MIKDIVYRFDGLNGVEGEGDWALHCHTFISASSIEKRIGQCVYFGNRTPTGYRLVALPVIPPGWPGGRSRSLAVCDEEFDDCL